MEQLYSFSSFVNSKIDVFINRLSLLPDYYCARANIIGKVDELFNRNALYLNDENLETPQLIDHILTEFRAHNTFALFDLQLCYLLKLLPYENQEIAKILNMKEGPWSCVVKIHLVYFEMFLVSNDMQQFQSFKEQLLAIAPIGPVREYAGMAEIIQVLSIDGSKGLEKILELIQKHKNKELAELLVQYAVCHWKKVTMDEKKNNGFFSKEDLSFFLHHPDLKNYLPNEPLQDQTFIELIRKYDPQNEIFLNEKNELEKTEADLISIISPKMFELHREKLSRARKIIDEIEDIFNSSEGDREKLLITYKKAKQLYLDLLSDSVSDVYVELKKKLNRRLEYAFLKILFPDHEYHTLEQLLYPEHYTTKDEFTAYNQLFGSAFKWDGMGVPADISLESPFSFLEFSIASLVKGDPFDSKVGELIQKAINEDDHLLQLQATAVFLFHKITWEKNCDIDLLLRTYLPVFMNDPDVHSKKLLFSMFLAIEVNLAANPNEKLTGYHFAAAEIMNKLEELIEDNSSPAISLYCLLLAIREERWSWALTSAKLLYHFDSGKQLESLGVFLVEKMKFQEAFLAFSCLKERTNQARFHLLTGLFQALGKGVRRDVEAAQKGYQEAIEIGELSGWWLLVHLKQQHSFEIEFPQNLKSVDKTNVLHYLKLFEPEKMWSEQKLGALAKKMEKRKTPSPEKLWEAQNKLFQQETASLFSLNIPLDESFMAEYQKLLEETEGEKNMLIPKMQSIDEWTLQKKELLKKQHLKLIDIKNRFLRKIECDKIGQSYKHAQEQFEKEKQVKEERAASIVKIAQEKVLSSSVEGFAAIQKEVEESLSGIKTVFSKDQEVMELKLQLKRLEHKNKELEKALLLKEQELAQERELEQMAREWTQEISQNIPPQHIVERVQAKIDSLYEEGKDIAKISKHYWNIKDVPTPNKKEMVSLLSLLGFQQKGQRGSHVYFMRDGSEGQLFCLFWSHENTLTMQEKKACLERVLLALVYIK